MENQTDQPDLVHDINNVNLQKSISVPIFIVLLILAVGFGFSVSYLITNIAQGKLKTTKSSTKNTVGITDKKTFKDKAEGVLKEGGIDGEGNFHLERPGGESQNVYLTSTTVDLSQFVDKKVRVWGETFSAEKAGWLMDVGSVEVLQ